MLFVILRNYEVIRIKKIMGSKIVIVQSWVVGIMIYNDTNYYEL
jgi:hypothetical protein